MVDVSALPKPARDLFTEAKELAIRRGNDEGESESIAWAMVKSRFEKRGEDWVAKSDAFSTISYLTFTAAPAEEFVSRSENGNVVQTYVLSDTLPDMEGKRPTTELLSAWAQQAVGLELDTDHELWNQVVQSSETTEAVSRTMRYKKGIAKIISAVVDAGRIIVKVLFDKRYEKYANQAKGLSVEGVFTRDTDTNTWVSGALLGATLALNSNPMNPRAVAC